MKRNLNWLSTIPPLKGKRNNYNLSSQRNTYGVGNPSPGKGQTQKCGRVKGISDSKCHIIIMAVIMAINATTKGGAGIYIHYSNGEHQSETIPTGLQCSNYKAEGEAIIHAAHTIKCKAVPSLDWGQDTTDSTNIWTESWKSYLPRCAPVERQSKIPPTFYRHAGTIMHWDKRYDHYNQH